jgi:hypothetical protein
VVLGWSDGAAACAGGCAGLPRASSTPRMLIVEVMATATSTRRTAEVAPRSMARRERVSIDLRGHSLALTVVAQSKGVPLRSILAEWLQTRAVAVSGARSAPDVAQAQPADAVVKVTLRMRAGHAVRLARRARPSICKGRMWSDSLMSCLPLPYRRTRRCRRPAAWALMAACRLDLPLPWGRLLGSVCRARFAEGLSAKCPCLPLALRPTKVSPVQRRIWLKLANLDQFKTNRVFCP